MMSLKCLVPEFLLSTVFQMLFFEYAFADNLRAIWLSLTWDIFRSASFELGTQPLIYSYNTAPNFMWMFKDQNDSETHWSCTHYNGIYGSDKALMNGILTEPEITGRRLRKDLETDSRLLVELLKTKNKHLQSVQEP